jgi:hypothetical protein
MLSQLETKAKAFAFPVRMAEEQLALLVEALGMRQDLSNSVKGLAIEAKGLLQTLTVLEEQGLLPDSAALKQAREDAAQALRSL